MKTPRRDFLKKTVALAAVSGVGGQSGAAPTVTPRSYSHLGRTENYSDFRIIDPGLKITKVESWTQGA